jgi:hypothetical protein
MVLGKQPRSIASDEFFHPSQMIPVERAVGANRQADTMNGKSIGLAYG